MAKNAAHTAIAGSTVAALTQRGPEHNARMITTCAAVLATFVIAIAAPLSAGSQAAGSSGAPIARDRSMTHGVDAVLSQSQQDKTQDVAGTWLLTVETAQGSGTPSLTLKQDGEKLTGTYSSQVFGEQQVTGTIKGNAITFGFTATIEGTTLTVTYSGTVEKDTMKGTVSLGDLGEGTFTGKKK